MKTIRLAESWSKKKNHDHHQEIIATDIDISRKMNDKHYLMNNIREKSVLFCVV